MTTLSIQNGSSNYQVRSDSSTSVSNANTSAKEMDMLTLAKRRFKRSIDSIETNDYEKFKNESLKDNEQRINEHPILTWFDGTRLDSWLLEHDVIKPAIFD